MSAIELKGGMYDMIAKVNDPTLLKQLYKLIGEIIQQNIDKTDFWDELTKSQQKELEVALVESYDEKNLVPHEEVVSKFQKWLKI